MGDNFLIIQQRSRDGIRDNVNLYFVFPALDHHTRTAGAALTSSSIFVGTHFRITTSRSVSLLKNPSSTFTIVCPHFSLGWDIF